MEDNKNNVLKILVPIIAVVVIFESVMVITSLSNKNKAIVPHQKTNNVVTVVPTKAAVQKEAVDLVFATENKEMKIGKSYVVELNMLGKINSSIDALDLYITYNKLAFDVSNLSFGSVLPKPTFSKISDQKSLIVANFLINEQGGLKIVSNTVVPVVKFTVRPKKVGSFDFGISKGNANKESVTMFVENKTSDILPFLSNKLNINVTK